MIKLLKLLLSLTIIFLALSILDIWYVTIIVGRYHENASIFMSFVTVFLSPLLVVLSSVFSINFIVKSNFKSLTKF